MLQTTRHFVGARTFSQSPSALLRPAARATFLIWPEPEQMVPFVSGVTLSLQRPTRVGTAFKLKKNHLLHKLYVRLFVYYLQTSHSIDFKIQNQLNRKSVSNRKITPGIRMHSDGEAASHAHTFSSEQRFRRVCVVATSAVFSRPR